jgi:hypothetical protein
MLDAVLKRFDRPDEVRTFEKGKLELVTLEGVTIGRATYEPGWRWSVHVGRAQGVAFCPVEHRGWVLEGHHSVQFEDGRQVHLAPGDLFYLPGGHDAWVDGEETYVSLHLTGASGYAMPVEGPTGR